MAAQRKILDYTAPTRFAADFPTFTTIYGKVSCNKLKIFVSFKAETQIQSRKTKAYCFVFAREVFERVMTLGHAHFSVYE